MNYIHLLRTTRETLSPHHLLTSALPAGQWALQHIDLREAQQYLNFINLMTYDFSGPWVKASGHHAQLFTPQHPHNADAVISCQSAVDHVRSRGVPAIKLVLGVPAYGRSFLGATGVGQAYSGHAGVDGCFEYCDLPRPTAHEFVDRAVGAAFCVGGDGGFVTYDTPDTVRMKAAYAVKEGLAGLFYWTGTGDAQAPRSLVDTGFTTLHATK